MAYGNTIEDPEELYAAGRADGVREGLYAADRVRAYGNTIEDPEELYAAGSADRVREGLYAADRVRVRAIRSRLSSSVREELYAADGVREGLYAADGVRGGLYAAGRADSVRAYGNTIEDPEGLYAAGRADSVRIARIAGVTHTSVAWQKKTEGKKLNVDILPPTLALRGKTAQEKKKKT